ncbi:MAG TPA: NADPH:quinone oxidoreductase family protein [Myxococcota bacterium]
MRAIVVDRWTEPSELAVREIAEPPLAPGQIRVDVRAAGCNFFDILMVQGRYQVKPPLPFVPGGEIAGVVRELGAGVDEFAVGDRVLAAPGTGGFAECAVVDAAGAFALPDPMSFEEGAALPIVYPTSYAGLVFRADLCEGEDLLVHAAAGGVGLAAVQIGKALGARVIASAGGAEKCEIARQHGADAVIDYRNEDFVERVLALTGGKGADVIYDSVGGDVSDRSLKCIAWNGRLLVIGFASGRIPAFEANRILLKNISITGLHWSAYPTRDPERVPIVFDALFELYAEGRIRPVVSERFPLEAVPAALEALGSRKTHGKVVITP